MNRQKSSLKQFRLIFFFAVFVFLILFITLNIVMSGTFLLERLGFLNRHDFRLFHALLFCMACLMVGTILASISGKFVLKSLYELIDATEKVASGDYSVRLSSQRGPEEIRMLAIKFNRMVEELDSVEMLRTDFVNQFSHEFKTPIVSIRGFAKALKWNDLTMQEREEYLDIIISESERLSELATNVLYLSKLEKQTILTDKKHFNISEQIRLVIALLDKQFSDKGLEIRLTGEDAHLNGNEEMLKQVWINLLDNAVKFSPKQGIISIGINQTADSVIVRISNQGDKIPTEIRAHIFDKFYQGDASHSTPGNGLGLSIVKKIVELHGGEIAVSSLEEENIFEVRLFSGDGSV